MADRKLFFSHVTLMLAHIWMLALRLARFLRRGLCLSLIHVALVRLRESAYRSLSAFRASLYFRLRIGPVSSTSGSCSDSFIL